jgi:BirA family biotin operon repressor/biotin-[acetyl-CoA-carboxylase] ligase
VNLATGQVEGLFEGIDADGVLLLRTGQGTIRRISAGDLFFDNMTGAARQQPGQEQE